MALTLLAYDIESLIAGASGNYTYVAYADDTSGTNFTTTYTSARTYYAIRVTDTPITSPSASDFTGLWLPITTTTYIGFASDASGSNFSTTFNSSVHTHQAILVTTDTNLTPVVGNFAGLWVPTFQRNFTYIAYADDINGTGFTTTYDREKAYKAVLINSAEITSPSVSDFTGLWQPHYNINRSLTSNTETQDLIPQEPWLIRNEEMDNTLSVTVSDATRGLNTGTAITVTAIDHTANTITLSWVPNIPDLFSPTAGEEWCLIDLELHSGTTGYPNGYYANGFRLVSGDYATKTFDYEWVQLAGGTETNTVATNRVALYNPDKQGWTRYTGNPVIDNTTVFGAAGSFTEMGVNGVFKRKSDGLYVLLLDSIAPTREILYATSPDLLNWTPGTSALFTTGRPSFCSNFMAVQGDPIWMEDIGKWYCLVRGNDGTNFRIGAMTFDDDFSNHKIYTNPIISHTYIPESNAVGVNDIHAAVYNDGTQWVIADALQIQYTGTHTGSNGASVLEDTNADWHINQLVYPSTAPTLTNVTGGGSTGIASNTATTVTQTASVITWNNGDTYTITGLNTRYGYLATSKSPFGPFNIVKRLDPFLDRDNDGAIRSSHAYPSCNWINFKGNAYVLYSSTPAFKYSGHKALRTHELFKYDKNTGDLTPSQSGPIFTSWMFGDLFRADPNLQWERQHVGDVSSLIVEESSNRVFYIYVAETGSSDYYIGVAYRDLNDYL